MKLKLLFLDTFKVFALNVDAAGDLHLCKNERFSKFFKKMVEER